MDKVTVFHTWDEPMADMAVGLLRSEGINAVKLGAGIRRVYPVTFNGLAEIKVRVPKEDAEHASEIIKVRFSEGIIPDPDDFTSE